MGALTRKLLLGSLTLVVAGCAEVPEEAVPAAAADPAQRPVETPPAASASPAVSTAAATSGEPRVVETGPSEAAGALLEEMIDAYQATPAFTDRIEVEFRGGGTARAGQECLVKFGPGTDASVLIPTNEFVALGPWLYLRDTRVPEKFVRVELTDNLLATCRTAFGPYEGLGRLVCALRFGEPRGEILEAMSFGATDPSDLGYRRIIDDAGRELEQIVLRDGSRIVTLSVDAATRFVVLIEAESPGPDGERYTMRHVHHPEAHAELPEPITFDTSQGLPLVRFQDLYRVLPGQRVPELVLPTLAGQQVDLRDLRGSVVVLDFWATWCQPCRRGLPLLQSFADWAAESGLPVRVYAVNVLERERSREANWRKASDFWAGQGFTMPSLIDLDGEVPRIYGIRTIPATYVIDPDGKLFALHTGFDEKLDESLRREVQDVLAQSGEPGK